MNGERPGRLKGGSELLTRQTPGAQGSGGSSLCVLVHVSLDTRTPTHPPFWWIYYWLREERAKKVIVTGATPFVAMMSCAGRGAKS